MKGVGTMTVSSRVNFIFPSDIYDQLHAPRLFKIKSRHCEMEPRECVGTRERRSHSLVPLPAAGAGGGATSERPGAAAAAAVGGGGGGSAVEVTSAAGGVRATGFVRGYGHRNDKK